eukprot:3207465-Rhodomonas_salina.2
MLLRVHVLVLSRFSVKCFKACFSGWFSNALFHCIRLPVLVSASSSSCSSPTWQHRQVSVPWIAQQSRSQRRDCESNRPRLPECSSESCSGCCALTLCVNDRLMNVNDGLKIARVKE